MQPGPILSVRDVVIDFDTPAGPVRVIDGVSFDVYPNETLCIVGESGSGKSVTLLSVMGLLPRAARVVSGQIVFQGREMTTISSSGRRRLLGRELAMIFQDPMTSLNPVTRVGRQIAEMVRVHHRELDRGTVRRRVLELLTQVKIPNPERRYMAYPHEFSGGMRQRAMIAMAMANHPALLIADEPTTALDVTIQKQVLDVLRSMRESVGSAMVLITHDFGVVAETADRVVVMYCGRVVESGTVGQVFSDPRHPYTAGLVASLLRIESEAETAYVIKGQPPTAARRPSGCPFHPRCGLARTPDCVQVQPELRSAAPEHQAACHFQEEVPAWIAHELPQIHSAPAKLGRWSRAVAAPERTDELLRVENLHVSFPVRRAGVGRKVRLHAVRGVSLSVRRGQTFGLVGESGCGKTTVVRTILGLQKPSSGRVLLNGEDLTAMSQRELRTRRPKMQVVFQDPYSSLDPRMTVHDIIAEPLRVNRCYRPERIDELLDHVGMTPEVKKRLPSEFSGGQRQRIGIARALALNPELLVLDEPVSSLDVSIQAQVINLLRDLQRRLGLTCLLIAHDLSVVRYMSHDIAAMYLGQIVETGTARQIFESPQHPYTQSLLAAAPVPQPEGREQRRLAPVLGDMPDPTAPPSGCSFRTRCPRAKDRCAVEWPPLMAQESPGHEAACWFAGPPEMFGDEPARAV